MKLKTLIVSVLVLVALSAITYFARRPGPPPTGDARLGQNLLDRPTAEKAARLRLSDQGKTVLLARQADGTWRVSSYYDLPADFQKLSTFVDSLTAAKLDRLVTSNADRIARLEFKDTRIDLLDGADKELWSVTLGKNPEVGGGRYVRFGSEQKAYLASLSAWLDAESKNWANAELLTLKADDVAKIELPFAEGGPVTVSRAKKDDPWTADKTPASQRVSASKVSSVLSSLGGLRFSDTNDLTDANFAAAKANERLFKIETFDHKVIKVALGRKPEEKKLKPPTATTDGKSGPAALGNLTDLAKKEEPPKEPAKPGEEAKPAEPKPLAPEFETIPAGPVFVEISHSDAAAAINAQMQKRAFQISDYVFTGLPQKAEELFEPAPPPPPPAPAAAPDVKAAAPKPPADK
jgi:hypothetical protein